MIFYRVIKQYREIQVISKDSCSAFLRTVILIESRLLEESSPPARPETEATRDVCGHLCLVKKVPIRIWNQLEDIGKNPWGHRVSILGEEILHKTTFKLDPSNENDQTHTLRKSPGFIVYCGCSPELPKESVKDWEAEKSEKRVQLDVLHDSVCTCIPGVVLNQTQLYRGGGGTRALRQRTGGV